MKGKRSLALLGLALLVAAVWLVIPKGGSPDPAPVRAPAPAPEKPQSPTSKPDRDPAKAPRDGTPVPRSGIPHMVKAQQMRADQEIARLVKMFNLTPEQESLLRAWYDERVAFLESRLQESGGLSQPLVEELAAVMRGEGLEEALAGILTPEQRDGLAQKKARDREQRVNEHVDQQMRSIERAVDLDPGQASALRELISDGAASRYDERRAQFPYQSLVSSGRNIDLAGPGLDTSVASGGNATAAFANLGEDERLDLLRSARNSYIEEIIREYGSVLTPEQAAQYRAQLESQSGGVINTALNDEPNTSPWHDQPSELPLLQGLK